MKQQIEHSIEKDLRALAALLAGDRCKIVRSTAGNALPALPTAPAAGQVLVLDAPVPRHGLPQAVRNYEMIFSLSAQPKIEGFAYRTHLRYITNPDKTLRWVFPANLDRPEYLSFYNAASWKARLYVNLSQAAFRVGLGRLLADGDLVVHHHTPFVCLANDRDPVRSFSIFMGTPGPARKLSLQITAVDGSRRFVKFGCTKTASIRVEQEKRMLANPVFRKFESVVVPEVLSNESFGSGHFSDIRPAKASRAVVMGDRHFAALEEMAVKTAHHLPWNSMPLYRKVRQNLEFLRLRGLPAGAGHFLPLLESLFASIREDELIPVSLSHGDFTPWNLYAGAENIALYDWEMAAGSRPMLFDLFHFVFQSGILIQHASHELIMEQIRVALTHPVTASLLQKFHIDTALHFRLYLLATVSFNLGEFRNQGILHPQAFWLMRAWKTAIADVLKGSVQPSHRKLFLGEFQERLGQTQYAALKWDHGNFDALPADSDLDLLVLQKDIPAIRSFCAEHPLVKKMKTQAQSFMENYGLLFRDNSFLSLDLIHDLVRKDLRFMEAKKVLTSSRPQGSDVCEPDERFNWEFLLAFYQLNDAPLPEKYRQKYGALPEIKRDAIRRHLVNIFGLSDPEAGFDRAPAVKEKMLAMLRSQPVNRGWNRWKRRFQYLLDGVRRLWPDKGFHLTFSGVDGAGKSTLIEDTARLLHKVYRKKVVVRRHRPSLLPILSAWKHGKQKAEALAGLALPRQGTNRSLLSSLLRFGYYYADYLFGQFYVYVRYILRGYIVLYDRYYFDFIEDPQRSNLRLPAALTKWAYRWLLKPEVNFFLFAPTEEIRKRKKELSTREIQQLTAGYLELFQGFTHARTSGRYISLENLDRQLSLQKIEAVIQPFLIA